MYLKKLEIQGFKSFADKISLDFSSGITSVVGPNGSGKSNIADAIRWVLGEQSARTLRGSKMEDVIFAGTEQRKPLGFSEVSLTIDNSDGLLPVEYSEVTITRRVFRSGESEYFINKTSCRLKDINELFFDTGLGKDGYSVIGQGRVDEILSNKSEDRRRIFEEASGIMKYRVRRQESEKKLESTKQNLLRIKDIIGELENQLEPLRLASETARKYLNLRENLKELEVSVFVDTITKHKEVVLDLENQLSLIRENIDSTNNTLEKYSIENRQRSELIKSMDEKLDSTRQEFYSLESKLERCLSDIKLNEEKTQNLLINIERIDKEMDQINLKLDGISREIRLKEDKLKTLNSNYNEYRLQLTEHEKKMEAQLSLLSESERNIEKLKVEMMYKIDNVSNKKLQINSLRSFLGNIIENYQSLESEIQQLILDNGEEKSKSNKLAESIAKSNKNLETYYSIRMLLNSTKDQLESKLSKYRNTQNSLKSEIQVKSSRYKMLNEMENNFEGYHKSVRSILKACRQSSEFGQGIHGALVQLIEVEKKYEIAIEMVLGSALQYIITTNEEDAKKAIQQLKITRMGRATFLPIASVNGQYIGSKIVSQLKKCKGFCGIASDLLSYDKEYNGIILSLLGRVVVVDNIDTGISIARDFRNTFKLVTLEGDIISTTGSMTGGSVADRGIGILSRSREINELKTEIQSLQKKYQSVEKEIIVLIEKINTNEIEISSIEEEIKNCQLVIVRDDSHLSQVKENISKNSSRIDMLTQEKKQLLQQEKKSAEELEKNIYNLNSIEKELNEAKRIISEHEEKHKEEQSFRDELLNNVTNCKIIINSVSDNINSTKSSLNRILEEKQMFTDSYNTKGNEKSKNLREIEDIKHVIEGLKVRLKKYNEEKSGKSFKMDRTIQRKKILEEEFSEISRKIEDGNKSLLLLQEELGRIELKKSRSEIEIDTIQNRMWDEYELTYSSALSIKKEIRSISQAQKVINQYRTLIKELGDVNVNSIDEYVKTKERYEFMKSQSNDMELAISKLNRVILEITSVMKTQFSDQFKLINDNFNIVFRELFGGGRARLILPDEENVLESDIEIEAQPPGKRLQNLMLLSGGERAFTAIALLFAILRLRPVPFCVLDEIEAALDEANVYRFLEYLKLLSDQTQFIMITHRKGTMEGSDMLYGVTMEEHGISKVVSIKIDESKAG